MLIGFTGPMGSGKTLQMTILAWALSLKSGMPVFSNYTTTFSRPVETWDDVFRVEGGILLLDEAHVAFDSRAFADDNGRTHFILQTRKKNLTCLFTTQHISQVDKRIRNVCDLVGMCSYNKARDIAQTQFVEFLSDKLARRIRIHNVSRFFGLYDTRQLVFNFKRSKGFSRSYSGHTRGKGLGRM